jgi:hypothetical protein
VHVSHRGTSRAGAAIRSVRIATDRLAEIAALQNTCPLAAEIAVRGLREVQVEIAPESVPGEAMARIGVPSESEFERRADMAMDVELDEIAAFDAAERQGRR